MAHPSSKCPAAYIAPEARIDLAMRHSAFKVFNQQPFTVPHLQSTQCGGTSIFDKPISFDFFYNALRLSWKVTGRVLHTIMEHRASLINFLSLEWEGRFIIMELFTDAAQCCLLEEMSPAFEYLTTVVMDVYKSQWAHWIELNTRKPVSYDQLIIQHAQNTSNQLSNFVLALTKADRELRAWAQHTAAQHLLLIVSPGHLPPDNGQYPGNQSRGRATHTNKGTDKKAAQANDLSALTESRAGPASDLLPSKGHHNTSSSHVGIATAATTHGDTNSKTHRLPTPTIPKKRKALGPNTSAYSAHQHSKRAKFPAAAIHNIEADSYNDRNPPAGPSYAFGRLTNESHSYNDRNPPAGPSHAFGGHTNPQGPLSHARTMHTPNSNGTSNEQRPSSRTTRDVHGRAGVYNREDGEIFD